ncbi:MAG: DUF2203 domain-containing protein [Planctomycetes bacterium]|nr:DUF2203 domain-containing protein [Planctomycetota bacterium]
MKGSAEARMFTASSAEKMLPLVRAIVRDIVRDYKMLRERVELFNGRKRAITAQSPRSEIEACDALEGEVDALSKKVDAYLAEMADLGVELKDYETGLCDFPSRMAGEVVYLCWRLGEEHVDHWHSLEAGYAGRRPIVHDPDASEGETEPE